MFKEKMRINAYIDGFNLYYAIREFKEQEFKWLDLKKLCACFVKNDDILNDVYYFSALASFDYEKKQRHERYIKALKQHSQVKVILGKFKKKFLKCRLCHAQYQTYEEKESDVNIAIQILEDAFLNKFDKAFLLTADTDLTSTVRKIRQLFNDKEIILLIPPNRRKHSNELAQAANTWREIKKSHIRNSLLPQKIGSIISPYLQNIEK